MREIPVTEVAQTIAEKVAGGLFLSTRAGNQQNVMTIGWGGLCTLFGAPCLMVPVRKSRYTYGLLRASGTFTVSIPLHDMRTQLMLAGTKSGRELDKFSGLGLTAAPAQAVNAPIVRECELHIECEQQGMSTFTPENLTDLVNGRWYPIGDLHTLFFGKVVRCYYTD